MIARRPATRSNVACEGIIAMVEDIAPTRMRQKGLLFWAL
jgi:hypothetical protein